MHSANVVLLGSSGTGKSTLVHRYLGGEFSKHHEPTKGAKAFVEATEISDSDGKIYDVLLTLLDTPCGTMVDDDWINNHIETADIVVAVYSILDPHSFEVAVRMVELSKKLMIPVMLVGNKLDVSGARLVRKEQVLELKVPSIEITAKRDSDITLLFETIGNELIAARYASQTWWQWWNGGSCISCRFCRHCGTCDCCPWRLSAS